MEEEKKIKNDSLKENQNRNQIKFSSFLLSENCMKGFVTMSEAVNCILTLLSELHVSLKLLNILSHKFEIWITEGAA